MPDARDRLAGLLKDERPEVYIRCARYLGRNHPSAETLALIQDEIARRKEMGAPEAELERLEGVARRLKETLASRPKGE